MPTETVLLIILAAFIAAGLALGYYFFKKKKYVKHWLLCSVFRFVTLFSVLLLLINPSFTQRKYTLKKPKLVLAVDNSKSIAYFKQDSAVSHFVNQLQNNPKIKERFQIENYTFGEKFRKNSTFDFQEAQTNLNSLFVNLDDLYQEQTAPTVLITDGNQTFGQDYAFSAAHYQQSIYAVAVGDTATHIDLRIDRLNANHYAFLNNKFPVEVFVNYTGESAVNQRFEIRSKNKVVFSKMVKFNKEEKSRIITAKLPANQIGVKTYTASITPLPEEKNKENNTTNFAVETIDEKTKVLILYNALHPDLGVLKKSIEHNEQRQAKIKRIDAPVAYSNYQMVVLYQPDTTFQKAYKKIHELGLNTLTITGAHTDYRFLNTHQNYFQKEITGQQEDYLPVYNKNFPAYQQPDIGFPDFPPLRDKFGKITFQKEFHPILYPRIQGVITEDPLLATVEKEDHRMGFLFGEGSWRWRAQSFLDTRAFETYDEFIGKLVQYLSSNEKKERLRVDFESFYNAGEKIIIGAQYFDENYEFDPRAKLTAMIRNKKTDTSQTFPFLIRNNQYQLNVSTLKAGEYAFTVKVEGRNLNKSGSFKIIDFQVEQQFLNANVDELKKLGPSLYFIDNQKKLVEQLLNDKKFKPLQEGKVEKLPLIDWEYLLLIIALSLTAEWFLRKYYGLI